jgi:hypothetical protein
MEPKNPPAVFMISSDQKKDVTKGVTELGKSNQKAK